MPRRFVLFCVIFVSFISSAYAEENSVSPFAVIPLPMNIPSNLFVGDVTPEFVQKVSEIDKIPSSLVELGAGDFFSEYAFVVDKKVRSLGIWRYKDHQWTRVAFHPTDTGKKAGDKHDLGDHRTPEGVYFLIGKHEGQELDYSKYGSRAFVTDYPNFFDRREGKTGSGIWLHAVPDSTPLTRGSRGCVVVRDDVIKKVTQFVSLKKTPIIIEDEESYLSLDEWKQSKNQFEQWIENWRQAWKGKDTDAYMSYYSPTLFRSLGKDWNAWRIYKESLNDKYTFLEIDFSDPQILTHGDEAVVRFLQTYRSNLFSDFGEKTLYLKKENDQWKIVSEQWQNAPSEFKPTIRRGGHATQVGAVQK